DVVFEKKPVILAAIEKDQAIFQQLVQWREVLAKERTARFADDVFFGIDDHLRDLLADDVNHAAPRRLQLRELGFDDVSLLAALEMFAALANPFLAFEDEIGELIADFKGEKFQETQGEDPIDLDVLLIF